jgi:hypothetical protein
VSKKASAFEFPPNAAFSNEVSERWLSTFRGRIGYARDNWLLYATAGGALANVASNLLAPAGTISTSSGIGAGPRAAASSQTQSGIGRIEYLYVGLQDKVLLQPTPNPVFPGSQRLHLDDHIVRVGGQLQAALEHSGQLLQALSSRSAHTGTWSEAISPAAHVLVDAGGDQPSAACGDSSRWSMRMPSFFCQAPAW